MATDSGWWARKLNQGQPPPENVYAPSPYQQAPMPAQQYVQAPVAPQSFAEAIQAVQQGLLPTYGSEAARTEHNRCPSCGSENYFSRRNGGAVTTQRGMASPAPQCYGCGYNGLYEQADAAKWQGAVSA
jgi:predicted nucleic-acid-binding Zn-ribbon protein